MGLIKAITGAIGGVVSDQWLEYFYCDSLDEDILVTKGQKKVKGRAANNNGEENKILKKWLKNNQGKYYVYFMQRDYSNSNYNRKNEGKTIEVVVTNYNASPNDPYIEPIPITMNM